MADVERVPESDDRKAIREILRDTGVLPEGSPSAASKGSLAVDLLAGVVQTKWQGEREARAAERLALRGELVEARQELGAERRRRRAAEKRADQLQRDLAETLARKLHLEFLVKFYEERHGAPVAEQLDILASQGRDQERGLGRLESELTSFLFLAKVALAGFVGATAGLAAWLPIEVGAVEHAPAFLYAGAVALVGTTSMVGIVLGRRAARRFGSWMVAAIGLLGVALEVLTYRRK